MDNFSLSVAQIELFGQTEGSWLQCGTATAFFYKINDAIKLVTNWHVVTGVDPTSMQPVDNQNPLPAALKLFYKQRLTGAQQGVQTLTHDIPLYDKDNNAVWAEHSTRQNVDVVTLDLDVGALPDFANVAVNAIEQEERLLPYAGMDCFVLGYPEGMIGPGRTPIWKRASIATEPRYNFRNSPGFLIDTATRNGMSGSPVVARHDGFFNPDGGGVSRNSIIGTVTRFVGIYSGRLGDDPLEVQLGMVWRSDVLTDIAGGNVKGYNPCR
jgi:hypothetical protein